MMQQKVIIAGPLPPPMHGASLVNRLLVQAVAARCSVVCLDLSPSSSLKGVAYHLSRMRRVLAAFWSLLSTRGVERCLIHVDGGRGLAYIFLLAVAARLRGFGIFLFHHSSRYVFEYSRGMAAVLSVAGPRATHVACSEHMLEDFARMYRREIDTLVVPNTVWVPVAPGALGARDHERIRLGFLSNLSPQKGLFRAIETLRRLREGGEPVVLHVAGTAPASGIVPDFEELGREFGDSIAYHGKVEGIEKERFFSSIDYFLFPSLYVHETQSLVVPEALAHGIDVVACRHRYVPELIVRNGLVVDDAQSYSEVAARWIVEDHRRSSADDRRKQDISRGYSSDHRRSEAALNSLVVALSR
jgi:glycosyltransferase involved in cell wall biosynthesis